MYFKENNLLKLNFLFQNAPKYVTSLKPEDELQIQYEIHSSIDFVEEKLKTGKKDMRELYLGLLYSTEDHKVYPLVFFGFHI